MPNVPLILRRIFGASHFGIVFGIFFVGSGVGAVLGPIFRGGLFDLAGQYMFSFFLDVSLSFVAAGILLLSGQSSASTNVNLY